LFEKYTVIGSAHSNNNITPSKEAIETLQHAAAGAAGASGSAQISHTPVSEENIETARKQYIICDAV
jgi:hypothetical protein